MDRNTIVLAALLMYSWSLSARRAWIEIRRFLASLSAVLVALRKESVDRNYYSDKDCDWVRGRSPQGERG